VNKLIDVEQIARVAHETNRAYCASIGDTSQKPWEDAEEWQRESARRGVMFTLEVPEALASAQHDAWRADKVADGWVYGPVKNAALKTHPCIVDYAELPRQQRLKDHLFRGVVTAFIQSATE
jgi:hypothetical protein